MIDFVKEELEQRHLPPIIIENPFIIHCGEIQRLSTGLKQIFLWGKLSANEFAADILNVRMINCPTSLNWYALCHNKGVPHLLIKIVEALAILKDYGVVNAEWSYMKSKMLQIQCDAAEDNLLLKQYGLAAIVVSMSKNLIGKVWECISAHTNDMDFLEDNLGQVVWGYAFTNPHILPFLERHIQQRMFINLTDCKQLNMNPKGGKLLLRYPSLINWKRASANPSMADYLRSHPRKIHWNALCENPNAIDLLQANPDKINWQILSTNPSATELLKQNIDMVGSWASCCMIHPDVLYILSDRRDLIYWDGIRYNPAIFEYNYSRIHTEKKILHAELIAAVYHPARIARWIGAGHDLEDYMQTY